MKWRAEKLFSEYNSSPTNIPFLHEEDGHPVLFSHDLLSFSPFLALNYLIAILILLF